MATHTAVHVQWQDGTLGAALPASGLVPVPHRNDLTYDFAVNEFVEHRDPFADLDGPSAPRVLPRRAAADTRASGFMSKNQAALALPEAPESN